MLDERHFGAPPREDLARAKLGQLRAEMKALGLEAAIMNRSDNVRLVTGILPTDSLLYYNRQAALVLARQERPVLFSASGFSADLRERVRGRFWIDDVRLLPLAATLDGQQIPIETHKGIVRMPTEDD
ncbi:MAG: hypothetical protein K6T75_06735, partial [Acetobacteraceae bacterium]|nr:hypothetical protein [Acetobacteraceae bacterium]